jgi:polyferredoxin
MKIKMNTKTKTAKKMKRQTIRKRLTYISFFLFPFTFIYFSPYVIVDASLKGIICGSFVVFILLFIGSLVFGRAFCSWACPIGGAQEILTPLKKKMSKKGRHIKWFVWTPWIISIVVSAIRIGGYKEIDLLFRTSYGLALTNIYVLIAYIAILLLIIIMYFAVGLRSFCRHICWIAPFMIIGRKIQNTLNIPGLRLVKTEHECTSCGRCNSNCLMGLDVEEMVEKNNPEDSECILCGNCADMCRRDCIELKFCKKNQEKK